MIIKISLDDGPTPISGNTIRGPPFGLGISANCLVLKRQDISCLHLNFTLVFVEDVNGIFDVQCWTRDDDRLVFGFVEF